MTVRKFIVAEHRECETVRHDDLVAGERYYYTMGRHEDLMGPFTAKLLDNGAMGVVNGQGVHLPLRFFSTVTFWRVL